MRLLRWHGLPPLQRDIAMTREALRMQEPHLFALADTLVDSIPEGGWKYVIGDDASGLSSAQFVQGVLKAAGRKRGGAEPSLLVLANAARVRDNQGHMSAVRNHLRGQGLAAPDRALVVARQVTTGGGLARLGEHLLSLGIEADYAVLCNRSGEAGAQAVKNVWPDSNVYLGYMPDAPPSQFDRVSGLQSVLGEAIPQMRTDVRPEVMAAAQSMVAASVVNYVDSRFSGASQASVVAEAPLG